MSNRTDFFLMTRREASEQRIHLQQFSVLQAFHHHQKLSEMCEAVEKVEMSLMTKLVP